MKHRLYTFCAVVITALLSAVASASTTTWNFETDDPNYIAVTNGSNYGNFISVDADSDGQTDLRITAWSDTGCGWNCGNDSQISSAIAWTNAWGLLNYNRDTSSNSRFGESHYVDNSGDNDMLLLSFRKRVSLVGVTLGYANQDSDFSAAAYSLDPSTLLQDNTWSNVAGSSIFSASYSNISTSYFNLIPQVSAPVYAKYWLIGAYNSVFGDLNDHTSDFLKIASITTRTTQVSEPATSLLLGGTMALVLFLRRRKKCRTT